MPRAFTEQERQQVRQRLIEAGYQQFSAHGLKKTNVEELAQAAHVSKGAFYLFYESKEALFMDVVELAEERYRKEVLAAVEHPGPSPRARLLAVFQTAFSLLQTIPVLQYLTGSDYDVLFRTVPMQKLEEHIASDRKFFIELIARCREAGIPFTARPDEIAELLYPIFWVGMHGQQPGANRLPANMDGLLELIAAFCLGEVKLEASKHIGRRHRERRLA